MKEALAQYWYVGMGGFLGAMARFAVSRFTAVWASSSLPLGTMIVNVAGSFILSFLLYSVTFGKTLPQELRSGIAVGFLGAFTTMSTFAYESMRFLETRSYGYFFLNVLMTLVLCFGAIVAGRQIAAFLFIHS